MNRNAYRIIFNKKRGQPMAVAESASAGGKAAAATDGRNAAGTVRRATLRPLGLALAWAFGAVALLPAANAQVVAYKAAPGTLRPTILPAANGVPLINVQTPSQAGVSRNQYERLDVSSAGAIFNNSRIDVATELGGWVEGNPWLARGTASVILNEVFSGHASQLNGYLEVAGDRAQLVIANPAGVTCDGCGFLNAHRVTLTTGSAIVDGGRLDGYRVDGGNIRIQGDGMDASRADYTDLIARAVEVNAGLWAQNLQVTAGINAVDAAHTAATPLAGNGERPAFAIDVARLGGMYAGKIVLVGTEAGVGVRNDGTLAAAAGDVVVTADGRLINRGAMLAGEHFLIVKTRGVENDGTLSGETQVTLSSQGDVVNRGLLHAGEALRLDVAGTLANRQGVIDGQRLDIRSAALDNDGGTLRQSGAQALVIETAALDNGAGGFIGNLPAKTDDGAGGAPSGNTDAAATGIVDVPAGAAPVGVDVAVPLVLADGSIVVQERLANTGSLAASGKVSLSATHILDNAGTLTLDRIAMSGESFRNRGDIAVDQIAIDATTIDNSGGQLNVARRFSAASRDFLNVQGVLRYLGTEALVLAPEERLDNRSGQIASNGIDLALSAITIDNTGGRIEHAGSGTLALAAERLDGDGGQIGSLGTLAIDAGAVDLDNAFTQGNRLNITADTLSNRGGSIIQNGTAPGAIAVAGRFDNTAGTLSSAASLVLSAGELDNRDGGLIVVDGSLRLSTTIGGLANDGGTISAQDDLTARIAGALGNVGGRIVAGSNLLLAAADAIDNTGGILGAVDGRADIDAGGLLDNTGGRIEAAAAATLSSQGLTNADGTVLGRTLDIDTRTQALDNTRGQLVAETRLTIASGEIDNAAGLIQAGTRLDIDTNAQAFINRDGGNILAQGDLTLKAGEVDNSNGTLGAGGILNIAADTLANRSGSIIQNGAEPGAIAVAGRLDNTAGTLASAASFALSAGELDNRDGGRIVADGSLRLTTATGGLVNDGGTISAQDELTAHIAGALGNAGGRIVAGNDLDLAAAGAIDNTGGTLGAVAGKADIAAAGHLTNAGGRIEAAADTTLSSQGLTNADGTVLGHTLDIDTRTDALDNVRGQLVAETRLAIASGKIDNADGLIQAGTRLDIDTHGKALINRDAGNILAQGDLALKAGEVDNVTGTLGTGGTLTLAAQSLDNRHGRIVQSGAASGAVAVAGRLDNAAGTLASAASLALSAGELDNRSSGRIVVDGNLTLTTAAGPLNNATGTISAQGSLTARVAGALGNAGGRIVAGSNLDLAAAGALGNTGGTLGAVAGKADIAATGHLTNTGGRIEAAAGTTLSSQGLTNVDGTVLGRTLGIDTRTGALDNTRGKLVAETYLAAASGRLDNTGGLIQAGARLDLDTHGQALVNRSNGNILAQGDIVLKAGEVDNTAGLIRTGGSLGVTGQNILNRSGQLLARTGMVLVAASVLDNRGGNVQAGGNLSASAATTIDNSGGLMRAGGTLTGYTARLDNTATQAAHLGVEGHNLDLSVSHVDNRDGALRADDTLTIRSSGTIDNRGGLMSSQGTLAVIDNSPARTLIIDNLDGTFVANRELSLRAGRVSGDGRLLSNGDLALDQVADIVNTGKIATAGDIRLSTAGTLTNSGTVEAGDTLTLQAATLTNEASGSLTGNAIDISVSGTLSNRGLINGGETRILAGTLDNLGSGRIYGDHLAIAAGTLYNLAEGGAAPVIAARERLDLGVGTLYNRDEALIFSAGDISIGRNLDASRRAAGQAGLVSNHAATIEALGNVFINAGQLRNTNAGITVTQVTDDPVSYDQFTPRGYPDVLLNSADYPDAQIGNFNISGRWAGDIPFREYWRYVYTGTTTRDVAATSAPGKIVSGGNMTLLGNVLNSDSRILAGSTLTLIGGDVVNFNTQGQTVTRYEGRAYYYDYDGNESCSDPGDGCYDISNIPYVRADGVGTISLGEARIEQYAGSGSGIPLDDRAAGGTAVAIAGAGSAQTGTYYGGSTGRTAAAGSADASISTAALPGASAQTAASGTKGIAGDGVARITQVAAAGNGGSGPSAVVVTARSTLTLPANRLYHVQPGSTAGYLVETDPAFANYRAWLSSDYMLQQLALDPALMQKRLGDGFYEQRLVTEQVAQLTGRRFLAGYASDEEQYRALMNAGLTYAEKWQLVPGIALSEAQMAALTTDIVWLVAEDVTLPDGTTERVLVPRVYARIQDGDLSSGGALLAAEHIRLDTAGDLVNSGTIAGRQTVLLDARDIRNENGTIAGQDVAVRAANDLTVLGGAIIAQNSLLATAGRDLTVESTTHSEQLGQAGNARIDRLAGLYVTGEGGTLVAAAGRDLTLIAAAVVNAGTGDTALAAGRDLTLATVQVGEHQAFSMRRDSLTRSEYGEVGSTISAGGDLALSAGNDLTARAADVTAGGALSASAGHDLTIEAGKAEREAFAEHRRKKSGFLSSSSKVSRDTLNETTAIASTFSGESVTLSAGNDLTVRGSNVVATHDLVATAGNDLTIEAATETHAETHYQNTKKSGLFGTGSFGVTFGSQQTSTDQQAGATAAAKSTVGSIEGKVMLIAGENYRQVGSDVLAPQGDIDIAAKAVGILETRETSRSVTETKSKQSGLTLAITSPVITALQTAQQMGRAAKDTKDGRMKALAAANVGLAANNAAQAVAEAGSITGGANLVLSLGGSKSSSKTTQTSDTAAASTLAAGRDITITARGAGEASDITLQGAQVNAAKNITLSAEDEIRLLAAQSTADQKSTNKNASGSIGISIGSNTGFTVGASAGRGKADGDDLVHTNTRVEAGETLTLSSGGDTTLRGAVAKGERVVAAVGGDLLLESLQDTSTYESKQKSLGGSITIGVGVSGAISASSSKVKSDYASVVEQSAIRAGDGGFDVQVGGDTTLTGGAITSTQKAVDENLNRFQTGGELTLTDIENRAEYEGSGMSVSLGAGENKSGKLVPQGASAGFGEDSGSAQSMTLAAISGIAGNKDARTGDAETGIEKIFDQQKVQKEIDAQTKITQTFGQLAPEAWGKHANEKFAEALKAGDEEGMRCWGPDGTCRAGGHAIIGGLTGGIGGAASAGLSSIAAPHVQAFLIEQGVPPTAASAVTQLAAIGAGAAVGGTAGATGAFNEASNNALILAIPLAETIMAGGLTAIRACVTSLPCRNALKLAGAELLSEMVSMLPKEEQALVPGYGAGHQPPPAGPLATPIPDPKEMQRLYGTPPLEDPAALRSWLANAVEGYPAEQAEQWAHDLIRTLPIVEQQRYGNLIIQAARDSSSLRNGHLAGSSHPVTGIPFNEKGYPDFSGVKIAEVKITQTGSRAGDSRAANEAAGIKNTPEGYVWHHHQDGETMQLVPQDIHAKTGHTGGFRPGE